VLPKYDNAPLSLAEQFIVHFMDKIADTCTLLAMYLLEPDFADEICVVEPLCDFQLTTRYIIRVLVVQGSGKTCLQLA